MVNVYVKEIAEGWIAMCGKCKNEIKDKQCECGYTGYPEYQERHSEVVKRSVTQSSFDVQVGGSHYTKLAIQPMEYSFKNKLDPCQHTAIKYITRFRDKGGREDLEKAIDCLNMLIELEYGK